MDQVNGYCQPNSGTDDKNTSLKDGKGYYRKDYACDQHNHHINGFVAGSRLIYAEEASPGAHQKAKDHHPEPKKPVAQNTVDQTKYKLMSKERIASVPAACMSWILAAIFKTFFRISVISNASSHN